MYDSNSVTVKKALNKSWTMIGIPFLLVYIGMHFVLGYGLPALGVSREVVFPVTALTPILFTAIPGVICSRWWFRTQIDKVDDKHQFMRRAIRSGIIFQSSAEKIIAKKPYKVEPLENWSDDATIPVLKYGDVQLHRDFMIVDDRRIRYVNIDRFGLANPRRASAFKKRRIWITLYLKGGMKHQFLVHVGKNKNIREFEYKLDLYHHNAIH